MINDLRNGRKRLSTLGLTLSSYINFSRRYATLSRLRNGLRSWKATNIWKCLPRDLNPPLNLYYFTETLSTQLQFHCQDMPNKNCPRQYKYIARHKTVSVPLGASRVLIPSLRSLDSQWEATEHLHDDLQVLATDLFLLSNRNFFMHTGFLNSEVRTVMFYQAWSVLRYCPETWRV